VNPIAVIWNFLSNTYHRLGSPREFYTISRYTTPVFGCLFFILSLIGTYFGLFVAPADYQQGDSFRILFVHVPVAWMSLFVYVVMATAGAIGLIWRIKMAFVVTICSAPIGAAFTALALLTGSIWGKPIWGTYWVWDARLTARRCWRGYRADYPLFSRMVEQPPSRSNRFCRWRAQNAPRNVVASRLYGNRFHVLLRLCTIS